MQASRSLSFMAKMHCAMAFLMLALAAFMLVTTASPPSSWVSVVPQSDNLTVYEVLESYGFPPGLLPTTVEDYTLDDDGSFTVDLESSCKIKVGRFTVRYLATISGTISYGSLSKLSGASVRVVLFWLKIKSITVSGTNLVFRVGSFSAKFPISSFSESPECVGVSAPSVLVKFFDIA